MKNTITVVGCGFVGSIFLDEMLKRAFAGVIPHGYRFIDFDQVDDRNAANQNFLVSDQGSYKAEVLQHRAMISGKLSAAITKRLTADNIDELLADSILVVDGVDNLPTRQLLWGFGMRTGTPVLHLGISEQGTGKVEWTHPQHDTFSLKPQNTIGKTIVDPPSGVTPPCELARMRGVGLNTGFAAAMAAAIFFGFDPEAHLKGADSFRWMTEWSSHNQGLAPIEASWSRVELVDDDEDTPPDAVVSPAVPTDDALVGV